ncbi:hypothetical protein ERJ75_000387400 [Trypanosoma vivax]|nr:hypothetical protein ERJ75_000890600 [Trypanosoma vivax]KAH8617417.1 hypothetical protein ERJ75_000387400 [Trypanosoma vivax]
MLQQLRTVLADARELQDRPEGTKLQDRPEGTKLQVYSSSREPRSGGGARGKVPGTDEPFAGRNLWVSAVCGMARLLVR